MKNFFETEPRGFQKKEEKEEEEIFENDLKEAIEDPDASEGIEEVTEAIKGLSEEKKKSFEVALSLENIPLAGSLGIMEKEDAEEIKESLSDFSQSSEEKEEEALKNLVDKFKSL